MGSADTIRQLVNFGFPEDRVREALENIGNPSDVEAATNWLLDHGEEDHGGAVEFKHCVHVDDIGHRGLIAAAELTFGAGCIHGCGGKENWVCLRTGETRCGRYANRHSLEHWQATKAAEEARITVADAARGCRSLGNCLVISTADLSIWCYECQAYVHHEFLRPLSERMEELKFGRAEAAPAAAPQPSGGDAMQASRAAMHGRLGSADWAPPMLARACDTVARPGYRSKKAHEYLDSDEVLMQKVTVLAGLIRDSRQCVAYTGAGISTASGISDYATKANDSVAKAAGDEKSSPWAAQPTLSHRVLVALFQAGHLKHWVQQNHDGLPQKAGYPQREINEIHGAWFDPSNPVVPMDGTLRQDLIDWLLEWEERADLCLALGTSMVGMNSDRMATTPAQKAKSGKGLGTVIVALQQTQYDEHSSLRIFAPIDRVMELLAEQMELMPAAPGGAAAPDMASAVFADLPYSAQDGTFDAEARTTLDLREGHQVRIVNQQKWDLERWGSVGTVIHTQDSLRSGGHFAIRMGGGGPIRVLGRWWLDAAAAGEVPSIPVVPLDREL